ncbi:TolC family protein [Prevotella salivae]|uniref:TolC family protein n=2 Tax=Segatella salivae TaxID=228604 RepID=A0AAW4NNM5_9BACT|nr:TolC family protein [Segatella salivae]EFV05412.1 outer membrane efflux protein [Segatella salivae DSM 15606]MBW4864478.1 TolC family protein [Segatella salivae]MBW4908491.1 TolC family protein [Segatella salivae]
MKNKILYFLCIGLFTCYGSAYATGKDNKEDSLAVYIAEAIRNNPGLKSEYQAYQAQMVNAQGAGVLSDPQLSVGLFPQAMHHVNGKQLATITIMQMFPWFGTLKAGREQMEYKAQEAYQKFREKSLSTAFNVEKQWYSILATQEKVKAVKRKRALLNDIKKVAIYLYKNYTAGRDTKMSDQLRLDAEEERLKEQTESLETQLTLQKQQFNITMHRQPNAALSLPDSIPLRQMPTFNWTEIERNNPKLAQYSAMQKAFKSQEEQTRAKGMPMIGVGLQYTLNGKVDMPMMPNMNGKDMVMPMVSVTIPIYRKKITSAIHSAQFMERSAAYNYQNQLDALQSTYLSIEQRADDIKRKLKLYESEVSLLNRTLELMQKEYATGAASLTDILQTTREGIDYDLLKAEANAQYNTITAEAIQLLARDVK